MFPLDDYQVLLRGLWLMDDCVSSDSHTNTSTIKRKA